MVAIMNLVDSSSLAVKILSTIILWKIYENSSCGSQDILQTGKLKHTCQQTWSRYNKMSDKQTKTMKRLYYTNNLCDSSYMVQYIFMFISRKHYLNELCLFKNNLKYKTLGHASFRYNNKKVTNIPESPSGDSQEEPRQHQMAESSSVTDLTGNRNDFITSAYNPEEKTSTLFFKQNGYTAD